MKNDIERLEKIILEQGKQIDSLKKAVSSLQHKLIAVSKQANRSYQNSKKNSNDINNVINSLRRNG